MRVALNNANPLVTRVVLDLDVKVAYSVRSPPPDGREMAITLAGRTAEQTAVEAPARPAPAPAAAPAAAAASTAPAAAEPADVAPATRFVGVAIAKAPEGVAITLRGNGRLTVAPAPRRPRTRRRVSSSTCRAFAPRRRR